MYWIAMFRPPQLSHSQRGEKSANACFLDGAQAGKTILITYAKIPLVLVCFEINVLFNITERAHRSYPEAVAFFLAIN